MLVILIAFVTFVSTFLGGLFALKNREQLHLIISFSVGVLLGVCFFDIVPEMFSLAAEHNLNVTSGLIAVVVGFLTIHLLEKTAIINGAHSHDYDDHEHRHAIVGLVGAGGLAFHSLLDGIGIGLGFHVSTHIGLLIAFAVIAHDFCDGLNTVTLMLVNKNTQKRALTLLAIDAAAPILGAVSTFFFTFPPAFLLLYLGFFVGFLLYIAASDLLPEAHSVKSSYGMIGLTAIGVAFIFFVTRVL